MPVRIEMRDGRHCVVKIDTGDIEKCYDTHLEAEKYATALNLAHARARGYVHNERPLEDDVKEELGEWSY